MTDPTDRDELSALVRDVAANAKYARLIGDGFIGGALKHADATVARPESTASAEMPGGGLKTMPESAAMPIANCGGDSLDAIRADLGDCTRCKLHAGRKTIVYGEGNPNARLMFVGEGPGADEDASGRPFVGAAGQLLDKIIDAIGFRRDDVYIANVVKCRPPENRKPERDEATTCEPFLHRQIMAVSPSVIVALGNTPVESLLGVKGGITRLRGKFFEFRGIPVMPTFHPAYLFRDPSKKREVWEDVKLVKARLEVEEKQKHGPDGKGGSA